MIMMINALIIIIQCICTNHAYGTQISSFNQSTNCNSFACHALYMLYSINIIIYTVPGTAITSLSENKGLSDTFVVLFCAVTNCSVYDGSIHKRIHDRPVNLKAHYIKIMHLLCLRGMHLYKDL